MATITEVLGTTYVWGSGPADTLYLWIDDNNQPGSLLMFVFLTPADWANEVLDPTVGWSLWHEPVPLPGTVYEVGIYRNDNPPVGSDDWELVDNHDAGHMYGVRVVIGEDEQLADFTPVNAGDIAHEQEFTLPGTAPATGQVLLMVEASPWVPG